MMIDTELRDRLIISAILAALLTLIVYWCYYGEGYASGGSGGGSSGGFRLPSRWLFSDYTTYVEPNVRSGSVNGVNRLSGGPGRGK
jgi:hypothetical protein